MTELTTAPADSATTPDPSAPTTASMPVSRDPRLPKLGTVAAFAASMERGWAAPDRTPNVSAGAARAAADHRDRLSAAFPGQLLVVSGGAAPVRSNDTYYDFRPDSNFYWLTACSAENAVLVMTPAGSGHDATVYLPAPAHPGDIAFFTDAARGELWNGSAPAFSDWSAALGVPVRAIGDLGSALPAAGTLRRVGPSGSSADLLDTRPVDADLARVLAELRMIKDEWEIAELRAAVDHTVAGFAAVVGEFPTAIAGGGERWLQGTFDRHARTVGNGVGYATIVGGGANAATLHWVRCDGPITGDQAVLLDMGVETRSFYTADVTRTFPGGGTFSAEQRMVHDLVEKSHRAALATVRPGNGFREFHLAAMEVIANGLSDWGLLPVSVDEALSPEGQHHRRYIVCGVGHHLGLDVHDCARSSWEAYQGADLQPGMVLTVEPGLYFHSFDLTLPPELRGIGVRIEDDILVTPTGADILSDALPLSADGIEAWMRNPVLHRA